MPVVINEFEVVPAPSPQPAAATPQGPGEAQAKPDPVELAKAIRRATERIARVWAH